MSAIVQDPIILLIPLISAFIGWFTNVLAVRMMFSPIEFIGIKPWIGWQGIVPANAIKLAEESTQIITDKLIRLRDLFEHFDAKEFASGNMASIIEETVDQVIEETVSKYNPNLAAPQLAMIRPMVRQEVEAIMIDILGDMREEIEDIVDLKEIVVDAAQRDRKLIADMFQRVGAEEFAFIKRSGAYFGFAFGLVQMFAWAEFPAWWVLPAFGFLVGYATNWLAIKLIFQPTNPIRLGPWVIQGLFHKRQAAVAQEFSHIVAKDILNADNMVRKMVTGSGAERLFAIVEKRVVALVEKYQKHPLTAALVPADAWAKVREDLPRRIRAELPKSGGFLYVFTERAVDIYDELLDRMTELDAPEFEGILRPPFQKDEWKLIVAGAALGLGAGVLQVAYLFGDRISTL